MPLSITEAKLYVFAIYNYCKSESLVIQDDYEIISRYLVLARDPIIPRADKPFKVNIHFTYDYLIHLHIHATTLSTSNMIH